MGLVNMVKNHNNKVILKKMERLADKVMELEDTYAAMTDAELQACTPAFKERLNNYETLDDLLPDAFACVREASWRVLKMKHFRVQVLGGIALHQGRIAEMRTGEGKTLVSTLPAYLNALAGKGVHVVTVNEYLAKRDAEWMGKVHRFLGLSVAVNVSGMEPDEKRAAYLADVTYCTNNELGFDYLRDNMVTSRASMVQRPLYFCIVDEVDSILIDEARTPLIISGPSGKSSDTYKLADKFAKYLRYNKDAYEIDEKKKTINLTDDGLNRAQKYFERQLRELGAEDLQDANCIELNHYINNALRANYMMTIDKDYIVRNDEVIIVDEFTGRIMEGRRFSEGLHQAIEAKENVTIQNESKTMATITFQNYFRLYEKLSGMTGTAKTEETEFNSIYKLNVIVIPPNRPIARVDENDQVYKTRAGKLRAVVADVKECYRRGQPVLVGTVSVDRSEELSKMLEKERVPHQVLNAKNHEREAEIVAQAGKLKAVTIATNMAGRGTDIILGGNAEYSAKDYMRKHGYSEYLVGESTSFAATTDPELNKAKAEYNRLHDEFDKEVKAGKEEVYKVGGLRVIGTERHESRRIDNQLRGRAGRQGDVGSTIFYLSAEDELLRLFGGERLQHMMEVMRVDEDTAMSLGLMTRVIENAQKTLEGRNFATRKQVLEFDNVMNNQRNIIYGQRNKVLEGENVHEEVLDMFAQIVEGDVATYADNAVDWEDWDVSAFNETIERDLLPDVKEYLAAENLSKWDTDDIAEHLLEDVTDTYEKKIKEVQALPAGIDWHEVERQVLLQVVDQEWMDHIDSMDILRKGIGLRSYGQQDPILAYKKEGFDMFDEMVGRIRENTARILIHLRVQIERAPQVAAQIDPSQMEATHAELTTEKKKPQKARPAVAAEKPGRNDPCPCGSGKKYKNCCGREDQEA